VYRYQITLPLVAWGEWTETTIVADPAALARAGTVLADAAVPADAADAATPADTADAATPADTADAATPADTADAATPADLATPAVAGPPVAPPPVFATRATPATDAPA